MRPIPRESRTARGYALAGVLLFWFTVLALGSSAPLRAEESEPVYQSVSVSTGVDLSRGAYDQRTNTDSFYVPFSIAFERGPWFAKFALSIVGLRGPGDPQNTVDGPRAPIEESAYGLGDMYIDLSYYWAPTSAWLPSFEFGGQLKIPTAEPDTNLGTGETDFSLGLSMSRWIGAWTPFVHIAYRFLGDNKDFQRNDGFATSIGLEYRLHERFSLGAIYDWRHSTNDLQVDPQEISPYARFRASDHVSVTPYAAFGLTSSALDVGGGFTLSYRF